MLIPFTAFFERLVSATDIGTQTELAKALGLNRSAVTQAKLRDAVPQKWILALARRYSLSPDWLEYGSGAPLPEPRHEPLPTRPRAVRTPVPHVHKPTAKPHAFAQEHNASASRIQEIIYVPKAQAKLCAGGGSFEVGALPVSEHPFPRQWLAKMGSPTSMVFMDVVGDSMEPGIQDGDMVLVDQSNRQIGPQSVLAVGLEDAIYLKRVEKRNDAILLHSDNNAYSDIEIYGDELDNFRVIGKVVWLCRDCRYWP